MEWLSSGAKCAAARLTRTIGMFASGCQSRFSPALAGSKVPGAWLSHDSPETSVLMQIPSVGAFVRAPLPVRLSGGHTVTYGVWVGIHPAELQRLFGVWWTPEYQDLRIDGVLANSVQPWGLLAAPVSLAVRDPRQAPYCSGSPEPGLSRVLGEE